ncbi:hypothetical protein PHYSODRAFT_474853 [Phytophthora sojae]|uniref:PH domain-containing protein n=1 Tax=Phytophthora sojae (strain P6497) TaxID=1094619 RepID=G4YPT6_PHYSP|nr:hypothetical protein PHYSODRAFT_474853 [Phytophthora sojae]EGZ28932.1 hypothetical protein PHYSODRAFT_474853 [Phytophthora sojae]|eukprot:XP_009516207.1 hypothetical protein PHYSODRAFT_474853 [Phytophthora sojae]
MPSPRARLAQRRGSSAEAALQAEVARLGVPDGVLKRGFLVKKGHVLPTRKERYFVLGQHSLSYYKPTKDGDVELKGVLELKASDVISPMPQSDVWLRIRQIEGPRGKSYKLDLKGFSSFGSCALCAGRGGATKRGFCCGNSFKFAGSAGMDRVSAQGMSSKYG